MSLFMQAEPVAPQGIAGGFVLVPVRLLLSTWRACRRSPLGVGDFRTWLACRELVARRCTLDDGRSPTFGFTELAKLTGVSEKRARASVGRLVTTGLLTWSEQLIEFPDAESGSRNDPDDETLADSIGRGRGSLAIPRRVLRLLVGGARPALIATVLAILLRCLSRGRGGFKSRGRVKSSWIARLFDVDLRRVKQARKELIDLGWIVPEKTDQWAENSWGRAYTIDLGWVPDSSDAGRRLPPPPAAGGRRLPPPDSDPELLRENKNQEPAPGGSAGVEIKGGGKKTIPPSVLATLATVALPLPAGRKLEPASPPPASVANRAGTSPARVEVGRPIPPRLAMVADGAEGGPLPAPTLNDVRVEDLKDTGRLLLLYDQAVAGGLVRSSEADRLRFVAAAEHARAIGRVNPCGLFARLVRGRIWDYLTQEDEDAASARLKRHLFGGPGRRAERVGRSSAWGVSLLSEDARVVRELRMAMIRAGIFRDPFPAFQARNPGWTRCRWDAARLELGVS